MISGAELLVRLGQVATVGDLPTVGFCPALRKPTANSNGELTVVAVRYLPATTTKLLRSKVPAKPNLAYHPPLDCETRTRFSLSRPAA